MTPKSGGGVNPVPILGLKNHFGARAGTRKKLYAHKIKNVFFGLFFCFLGDFWEFWPFCRQKQCNIVATIGMQAIEEN